MEIYNVLKPFIGFKEGEKVSKETILSKLDIPVVMSEEDFLLSLTLAGILSYVLPVSFEKLINVNSSDLKGFSFINKYSLIHPDDTLYASEVDGFPDATIEELIDLGYNPKFNTTIDDVYMEFNGGIRKYPGEKITAVYRQPDEATFLIIDEVLTRDFLVSPRNENSLVKYFTDRNSAIIELMKQFNYSNIQFDNKFPVEQKIFSLKDIVSFTKNCKENNGSPFAKELAEGIIECAAKALLEVSM